MCNTDSYWEVAIEHRELSMVLCDDLEGCDGGGEARQREDMCTFRAISCGCITL